MIELRFRGEMSREPGKDPGVENTFPGSVRVKAAGQIRDVRGAGQEVVGGVELDDVLELELEGGLRCFVSIAQLRDDLRAVGEAERGEGEPTGSDTSPDVLNLLGRLAWGEASRRPERGSSVGGTRTADVAVVAFQLLAVETAAGATARALARALESRLRPEPGIYLCPRLDAFGARVDEGNALSGKNPILVLVHGTASSTAGSFGGLQTGETGAWSQLRKVYGERIVACEHRTLSESPIANALQLLKALPTGATLHLLTHSRGGLVGELLCGGWRLDDVTKRLFAGRVEDLDQLGELESLLASKCISIPRFVRVACPARGTTLASRRLDRYASLLFNAFGLLPSAAGHQVFGMLKSFALAVAKMRTDPEKLPGLEAMMPESPLIGMLNGTARPVDADLTVIAGDLQGKGLLSHLKEWATDLFYRENHDLVVNTSAMMGGVPRLRAGRFFFAQGPEIDHFRYFQRDSPALGPILWGLSRKLGNDKGIQPIEDRTAQLLATRGDSAERGAGTPKGTVFLIPAALGTHLDVLEHRVWLDPRALALGELELLRAGAPHVKPKAILAGAYRALFDALKEQGFRIVPFPYDWRLPPEDEAKRLAEEVREKLDDPSAGPVGMLAHTSGSALLRYVLADQSLQARIRNSGGRIVQLGVPRAERVPFRQRLLHQLDVLDLEHSLSEVESLFEGFRGLDPVPGDEDLFASDLVISVAGRDDRAPSTPSAPPSPGTGATASAPNGLLPWRVEADRGDLASHQPAFRAYADLLRSGSTKSLERVPLLPSATGESDAEPPKPEIEMFPDAADLTAAALGGRRPSFGAAAARVPLEVSVAHGNLAFAPDAILLGHYEGDVLASAELFLDQHFNGRLSERRRLDRYPGPVGTAEVVFHPDGAEQRPPAGLIVGLGPVGDLNASKLEEGVTLALVEYAIKSREKFESSAGPLSLRVASLLIGTGDNMLSVEASVAAIVAGALGARERLERGDPKRYVRLEGLTFVELYLDRAIQAAGAVETLRRRQRFVDEVRAEAVLDRLDGGRRRVSYGEDPSWWSRLKIEKDKDKSCPKGEANALRFTLLTNRARAEESPLRIDTRLVDPFVLAMTEDHSNDPEVSGTLYELLIPNRLKDMAPQRRDQVLVLDEAAAAYPWELIHDKLRGDADPLAVRAGLVRQLTVPIFRELSWSSLGNEALIVGDTQSPPEFADLPAARQEAQEVEQLLNTRLGSKVTTLIKEPPTKIVQALFARPYRILHLSTHGVYRWNPVTRKACASTDEECCCVIGMLLGDNVFLTSDTVEQLRFVPDLVFLNCCFLGKVEPERIAERRERPRLAANLAAQFIRMGARAVVAAGWTVSDQAASAFAVEFYERMLAGDAFGRAVQAARQHVYRGFPGTNTWGAYQCYGDPGWVLRPNSHRQHAPKRWVAIEEMVTDLRNLIEDARTASGQKLTEIAQTIAQIEEEGLCRAWLHDASLLAALGGAWGEIGDFDRAIARYGSALQADQGEAPIATVEQLANLRSRRAFEKFMSSPRAARSKIRKECLQKIEESRKQLEALPPGAQSGRAAPERLRLLGSCSKRRSALHGGKKRLDDLQDMAKHYRKAEEAWRSAGLGTVNPYSSLNALTAEVVLYLLGKGSRPDDLDQRVETAVRSAGDAARKHPTFWQLVARSDGELVRRLTEGTLPTHLSTIVIGYQEAIDIGSPREVRSILDHLIWLAEILAPDERSASEMTTTREGEALPHREIAKIAETLRAQLPTAAQPPGAASDPDEKSEATETAARKPPPPSQALRTPTKKRRKGGK